MDSFWQTVSDSNRFVLMVELGSTYQSVFFSSPYLLFFFFFWLFSVNFDQYSALHKTAVHHRPKPHEKQEKKQRLTCQTAQ